MDQSHDGSSLGVESATACLRNRVNIPIHLQLVSLKGECAIGIQVDNTFYSKCLFDSFWPVVIQVVSVNCTFIILACCHFLCHFEVP